MHNETCIHMQDPQNKQTNSLTHTCFIPSIHTQANHNNTCVTLAIKQSTFKWRFINKWHNNAPVLPPVCRVCLYMWGCTTSCRCGCSCRWSCECRCGFGCGFGCGCRGGFSSLYKQQINWEGPSPHRHHHVITYLALSRSLFVPFQ